MSYAIETVQLTKRYPQTKGYRELILHPFKKTNITALDNVSIHIEKGEVCCLLGPNGAGKTTLIKILCTLVFPTEGKAFVNGHEVIKDEKAIRKSIGYVVADERSFYWRLTGRQNLEFFATLNNLSKYVAKQKTQEVLELVDLLNDAHRPFRDYSSGMKQRLAIARGLLTDPEILFMDEPTKSLDIINAEHLRSFIKAKLVEEKKKTVVFATHNLQEAEQLADRIVILHRGEAKFCGAIAEFRKITGKGKIYLLHIKGDIGSLEKMVLSSIISSLKRLAEKPADNETAFEIILNEKNDISSVITEIVTAGGQITSCTPKELPLAESFSQTIHSRLVQHEDPELGKH